MRKAWFCYEINSTGVTPVIHYDNDPIVNKGTSPYLKPKIVASHFLDDSFFRDQSGKATEEVAFSFNWLMKLFPAPVETN